MSNPISDFIDWMATKGWQPDKSSDIVADDKPRYIRASGDKIGTKKIKYILKVLDDKIPVGGFVHYREGEWYTYPSKLNGKGEYTEEEKKLWRERIEAEAKAKEEERAKAEAKAAKEAKIIWDGAEYARPDHPYLVRKRIKPHNFKQHEGKLLIPMWADKRLQAFQSIDEDGDKLYFAGARKKGCYCPLMEKGEATDIILFAEGAATAATIREIIGLPVVICFDAGNILSVVMDFRKRYPQSKFIICADNDQHQRLKPTDAERVYVGPDSDLNTGIVKAKQAAAAAEYARVVYPVFPESSQHTDWNDLAVSDGEEAVRARIDEALSAPMPEPPKPKAITKRAIPAPDTLDGKVDWRDQLIFKDKYGNLAENSVNYKLVVCNHSRMRHCFAYDEFHLVTMVVSPPAWVEDAKADFAVHPLSDTDIRNADYFLQKTEGLKGSKEKTTDAIEECGLQNAFHPARDHLAGLEWDGTPRLDNWLLTYTRAKDDPAYLRAIGSKWLIGGVKRLMEPGCQMDNMLVLEGIQDAGKSRTFRTLSRFGPPDSSHEYFMDTFNISDADDTDELMKLAGSVIIEIQEMSGFNRKDDDAMKKFISTTHDTYRAPYGRRPHKWPRQFVLGGTYNPKDGIFKDSTGLKRYWMVETGPVIDLAGLERDREQLWAEAFHRYKHGEGLVLSDEMKDKARVAAEQRRIVHVMTDDVLAAIKGRTFFTTKEVLQAMGVTLKLDQKSQSESFTVNDILRVNGFRRCQKPKAGKNIWGWEPPLGSVTQGELIYEHEEELEF